MSTGIAAERPIKVWLVCTGVGLINRGIETFARECYDGLRGLPGLDLTLWKGVGPEVPGERVLPNFTRTGRSSALLGKVIRRNPYVVEQLSSFLPLARRIRKERPDVIFTSEANLRFQLFRWRRQIGVPYRILYSNGGPCHPPFDRTDFVHQVAPAYFDEAIAAGEPPDKHILVPYGITVPNGEPPTHPEDKREARGRLGLPADRPVVLSVGWISAEHKRMDYVVREVAALPQPRPFLMMLGLMDDSSTAVVELADRLLGSAGFAARSVPYHEVQGYYQAADVFTLGSLKEGFGRVYLEAVMAGLPVIAHDHPVMRYVLGDEGRFADLSVESALTKELAQELASPADPAAPARRRESVRRRFSWPALAGEYAAMFRRVARGVSA